VIGTIVPKQRFIFSGGRCFYIRYDDQSVFSNPKYSFEDMAKAINDPSESYLINEYIKSTYGIFLERIILEESSTSTDENAIFSSIILKRLNNPIQKLGVLTNLYHMKKALEIFQQVFEKIEVEPIFAEDWCIFAQADDDFNDNAWCKKITNYITVGRDNAFVENQGRILDERIKGSSVSVRELLK